MTRLNMRDEFLIPRRWLSIGLAVAGMTGLHAWAQALPDAGSIRQQIEPSRAFPLPPAAPPQRVAPTPEIKPPVGMTVNVKSFQLLGHRLLSTEELMPALAEFVGRTLDFAGLQRATDAVAAAYRESGWLARVYLPEQDISEGTITLQVVEARFAGLRLEGEPSKRVLSSDIEAFFEEQQKTGEPLNTLALDRALLLADDLPGISVAGTLVPGQAEGETGLAIQTNDEALIYGEVTLDNTGARSRQCLHPIGSDSPCGLQRLALWVQRQHDELQSHRRPQQLAELERPRQLRQHRLGLELSSRASAHAQFVFLGGSG